MGLLKLAKGNFDTIATVPKVLVIDNYDSFVYNLVQYLAELGAETVVVRNDEPIAIVETSKPTHILLSPGPGKPADAGICIEIIKRYAGKIPILGVCLGHQAIGEAYGATVSKAPYLMHGKTSRIKHHGGGLFKDIPEEFTATRYHSLIIDRVSIPEGSLQVDAETEDGLVMAVSHPKVPGLYGVQYHPESILSEYGHKMLENFLVHSHCEERSDEAIYK